VLLAAATQELVRDRLPHEVGLRDLGEVRLKTLPRPERVFQLVAPGLPSEFPPLRTLERYPGNPSAPRSSFVGREREISGVKRALEGTRLLTLTGEGGSGKTRLALEVARDLTGAYPDGVWLVELAPLSDGKLVPKAVAGASGVMERPGEPQTDTLSEVLRDREMLLILDNCEHLLEATTGIADRLLDACARLRIIAARRWGRRGELRWPVPPLMYGLLARSPSEDGGRGRVGAERRRGDRRYRQDPFVARARTVVFRRR
jgi:hypothetical protein